MILGEVTLQRRSFSCVRRSLTRMDLRYIRILPAAESWTQAYLLTQKTLSIVTVTPYPNHGAYAYPFRSNINRCIGSERLLSSRAGLLPRYFLMEAGWCAESA